MHSHELNHAPAALSPLEARVINRLQGDLPLVPRPFAQVAAELGLCEDELLETLRRLLANGTLTRFGPLFQIERAGGKFVLAAMAVPQADYARVTELVNSLPEVAHNYRREHALNMWFVLACASPALATQACERISQLCGLTVHAFPKEREFFVGLHLEAIAS